MRIETLKSPDWTIVGVVSAIVLTFLLLSKGSILMIAAPIVVAIGLFLTINYRESLPLVFLVATYFILRNTSGLNIGEIIFYSSMLMLLVFVLIPDILKLDLKYENKIDTLFFLLYGMVLYGVFIGLLQRNSVSVLLIDGSIYAAILGYFPFRKYLSNPKNRDWFLGAVLLIIILVCIRNFVNYRQIIIQATMAWELELARSAVNEIVILMGCVVALVLFSYAKTLTMRISWGVMLTFLMLGLILTQSRGFWVTFALSTAVFLYFADTKERVFAISLISAIFIGVALVVLIFFYDLLEIIIYGFQTRILSLLEAGQDVSLMERVVESRTVMKEVVENPIAGHGLGAQYIRHNMLFGNVYKPAHYIHNGYIFLWYKFGIFGLILMPVLYLTLARYAYLCFKHHSVDLYRQVSLGIMCIILPAMILNMTSPLYSMFDGLFFITLSGAFIASIYEDIKHKVTPLLFDKSTS
jgi:O-antigen ligase